MIKAKQEANDNEYVEKDKITLEEWLKKWIRIHKRPFVKPRTLQGYIEKIRTNIIPYLGDYPMQSLDRLILQEYFSDLTTGNEKKGIKTYNITSRTTAINRNITFWNKWTMLHFYNEYRCQTRRKWWYEMETL